ncbi:alpha-N-arabinofuranosidase [Anaerolentibacter hominis]|uniref:alpha-N-arabinofuranosidase n=1 Tax=Anaerolentibacter hominis TaxID=3079009 RepID=UPI0031B7EF5F
MNKLVVKETKEAGYIHPELHSQFIEFLGTCIYDGLWVGEDSEIPNYHGMRKSAVDALKELEPPVIRWPGGCYADTYHWRDGIGPRDKRPVTYNENFATFTVDHNEFGTHEFMELCGMVGAKPWININLLSGTVGEMKEWMEYCNRREETSLSRERAANGSPEPFAIEYWGIGNECWNGGGRLTAESYAQEYRKFVTAMPLFDTRLPEGERPYTMKRIASGPDGNKPRERVRWTEEFFRNMAQYRQPPVDAYDLHFYNWCVKTPEERAELFNREDWYRVIDSCLVLEDVIQEQYKLIQEGLKKYPASEGFMKHPAPTCDLVVGEWGNWYRSSFEVRPALYQQCTMRDAITSALTLDIFHRNCNMVKMACVAQTINVLNSLILTDGEKFLRTPNFDVFMMYKVHRGAKAVELNLCQDYGRLHTFASRKNDRIYVNIVNADMDKESELSICFEENTKPVQVTVLAADAPDACNTFDMPDRVRAKAGRLPEKKEDTYRIKLPAASVSVCEFQIIMEVDLNRR